MATFSGYRKPDLVKLMAQQGLQTAIVWSLHIVNCWKCKMSVEKKKVTTLWYTLPMHMYTIG